METQSVVTFATKQFLKCLRWYRNRFWGTKLPTGMRWAASPLMQHVKLKYRCTADGHESRTEEMYKQCLLSTFLKTENGSQRNHE
jgi:hypothetical protein